MLIKWLKRFFIFGFGCYVFHTHIKMFEHSSCDTVENLILFLSLLVLLFTVISHSNEIYVWVSGQASEVQNDSNENRYILLYIHIHFKFIIIVHGWVDPKWPQTRWLFRFLWPFVAVTYFFYYSVRWMETLPMKLQNNVQTMFYWI